MARKKTDVEKDIKETDALYKKLEKERQNILSVRIGEVATEKKKHEAGIKALEEKIKQCDTVAKNLKKVAATNEAEVDKLRTKLEKLVKERQTAV